MKNKKDTARSLDVAAGSAPTFPRPATMRRVWVPGIQYTGETDAQMAGRERICREDDARADAEEARLWKWKITPWWLLPNV